MHRTLPGAGQKQVLPSHKSSSIFVLFRDDSVIRLIDQCKVQPMSRILNAEPDEALAGREEQGQPLTEALQTLRTPRAHAVVEHLEHMASRIKQFRTGVSQSVSDEAPDDEQRWSQLELNLQAIRNAVRELDARLEAVVRGDEASREVFVPQQPRGRYRCPPPPASWPQHVKEAAASAVVRAVSDAQEEDCCVCMIAKVRQRKLASAERDHEDGGIQCLCLPDTTVKAEVLRICSLWPLLPLHVLRRQHPGKFTDAMRNQSAVLRHVVQCTAACHTGAWLLRHRASVHADTGCVGCEQSSSKVCPMCRAITREKVTVYV